MLERDTEVGRSALPRRIELKPTETKEVAGGGRRPGDPPPAGQMAKCGTCSVDAFRTGARRPTYRRSCGLGRVIPCSDPAQQRHNIIRNRVALVGEESVSGVTAELPPGQSGAPTMRIYIIGNDGITRCREAPATVNDGEIAVASNEELHAAPLSAKRLLALWNALPDVEKRKKIGDRDALIDQLASAIEALPDPEPQPYRKPPSKQDVVLAMLCLPEGATVDEVASVTGWQRHTVRGVFSGTLKKKLGLTLTSVKGERGGVYRIAERANL